MRLFVTICTQVKSIMDWVHQLLSGPEIRHLWKMPSSSNKDCQRKNTDPTTGLTIELFGTKQTLSKL